MAESNGYDVASFLRNIPKLPSGMEVGVRNGSGQIDWVAPNKGAYPLAHIATYQSVITTAAKTYRESDEAIRASRDDARHMRNDCGIMESLEARQRCTALLDWHIEPEDDSSQEQRDLASAMEKITAEIVRFTEYRRSLMEAIWFGKQGVQNRYGWQKIGGVYRCLPTPRHHLDNGWQPINGDKMVFRFDDGSLKDHPGAFEGQMGIRVGLGNWRAGDLVKDRWKVEATERGMAYFLTEEEQKLCVVHKHMIEDAAYEDAISAGSLHGVGIRGRIYWEWFQKQSCLGFLMEFLERSAGGIELWHFPAGNDKAKEEVKTAATERLSNSRNVTLVPIPAGENDGQYGVQIIEPGMAGVDCLKDLLEKYFGHRIKRYIMGQTLSSEAEATGMGSGVAEAHIDTLLQIVKYDATNLEETLTRQLLRPMQLWNFPKSKDIRLKFRIETEDDDMEGKLEAYQKAYGMGLKLKAKDVYEMISASMPTPTDEVLSNQQQPPAQGMGQMPPGGPGGDPGANMPRGDGPPGGGPGDQGGDQPGGQDDGGGESGNVAQTADNADTIGPDGVSRNSRQRYSRSAEWTDEDERKHPRGEGGKFAAKGSSGHTVKLDVKKMGNRWYGLADLPDGGKVTRSHEDEHEARRLAREEIESFGHTIEGDDPAPQPAQKPAPKPETPRATKPAPAPTPEPVDKEAESIQAAAKVKANQAYFGTSDPAEMERRRTHAVQVDLELHGKRYYALADLPNGQKITRSAEEPNEALRRAFADVKDAGEHPSRNVVAGVDFDTPAWQEIGDRHREAVQDSREYFHSPAWQMYQARERKWGAWNANDHLNDPMSVKDEPIPEEGFRSFPGRKKPAVDVPRRTAHGNYRQHDISAPGEVGRHTVRRGRPGEKDIPTTFGPKPADADALTGYERNALRATAYMQGSDMRGLRDHLHTLDNQLHAAQAHAAAHNIPLNESAAVNSIRAKVKVVTDMLDAKRAEHGARSKAGKAAKAAERGDTVESPLSQADFDAASDKAATAEVAPGPEWMPGPHDGDRNADGLVFHDGRWHRDDKPEATKTGEATREEMNALKAEAIDANWQEQSDKYGIDETPKTQAKSGGIVEGMKAQDIIATKLMDRWDDGDLFKAREAAIALGANQGPEAHAAWGSADGVIALVHAKLAELDPSYKAPGSGPKEGDVNPAGLVFRDGRWHRDDKNAGNNQPEGYNTTLEDKNHVAKTGERDQGTGESGMAGAAPGQPAALSSTSGGVPGDAGGPGSVPASDGVGSGEVLPGEPGQRNGQTDGAGTGDGNAVAAGGSGPGNPGGGLGAGGSDGGYRSSGGEAVVKSYREKPTVENPTDASAGNWRYHTRDFYQGGIKAKFRNNLEAIKTMKAMADEGRTTATPAEQETLSRFVGWGAMPGLFNEMWDDVTAEAFGGKNHKDYGSDAYKKWLDEKDKWRDERAEIKPLMTDDEWAAARKATLNSHFTHPSVVDAHWKMAQKMGFTGGRFLEPSAGIGYYMGLMPADLAGKTRVTAVELDPTTGNMLAKLYPSAHVEVRGFEKQQSPNDFYNLVASNVPFGDYQVSDPDYNKFNANIHDYFFLKSADLVKPGGMVMHVTSAGTMDKTDSAIRQELAKTCDLVAAVRFPGGAHQENAGTEVVTDMLMLRKRHPGEAPVTIDHTPPEAMPPWQSGGETAITNEEHNARLNKIRDGESVDPIPEKKGFTGMTTDSLGRVYHWVDGKRVPGPDWMSVKMVPDPAGGEDIPVNAYFADHPEQILGTLDRTGTMYGGKQKNVSLTDDYDERLQAAIDRLPEGVFTTDDGKPGQPTPERREATAGVKDLGWVIHDGKLFQRRSGAEVEKTVDPDDFARIEGQLGVRDAMQAVINAELAGEPVDEARTRLNTAYDAYVKKYGPLSNKDNRKAMGEDPDAVRMAALESSYDAKTKKAVKADIFSKSTVRSGKQADHANGVPEGVGVCLNETGGINPAKIAELTGKSVMEVEGELRHGGLAFEDPATGWQPASLYLSGNVRQKLVLARAAAAVDSKYQHNVDALENHQPEDIDFQNISIKAGAGWVPAKDMEAFAQEITGTYEGRIAINYVPQTGQWIVEDTRYKANGQTAAMDEYSTPDRPFADMLQRIMNSQSLVVEYKAITPDGNESTRTDMEATRAAEDKAKALKDKFSEWIWENDDRRERLARFYNDNFNNIVPVHYDGSHLQFPGMRDDFEMRDIQKNFVYQVITTGRGLAAHEVGTGKTASMIAAAMELRRLGLAKKPCIACLKANINQITAEAQRLYPNAKILSTANNFSKLQRKETISRMSTGDYDMVIMTHDNMNMLGMRPQVVEEYVRSQLNELEVAKKAAWKADPDKDNRVVKALEKAQQRLETRLQNAIKAAEKDDAVHFEETGIDQLFVDEAHIYKNLPVYSSGERVKGIPPASTGSDRATNMLMRAQWLMKQNGGRGVVFATGTPVSNSMVELYNIQRYLQPDELKSRGLDTFDAWASAFGERQTETEITAAGDYDQVTRFNKFTNVPELMNMASLVMDVQRADNMKHADGSPVIIRPKRHDSMVVTPMNDMTARMMADLKQRAVECKGQRPEKGMDNMAVVCMDGRKGSVDMRMLYHDAPDDPNSKLNKCVQNVLKLHNERPGVTQCIFSNVGVNPSTKTGFHVYGDIIEKLVAGGIPREKIADFSKLEDDARHEAEIGMRNGTILVGIGSTEKLGTGVNVQHKLAALHHLDVPWKPSEIEQRDGRGWRHGNLNDPSKPANEQSVAIHRYVSEGSLDQFMWQTVGSKAAFINQTVNAKDRKTRSISDDDTETLTPEQFMAVASGDPNVLRKVNLQSDLRELRTGHEQHRKDQVKLAERLKEHEATILPAAEGTAARYATDAAHVASLGDNFAMKLGDTLHTKRADAEKEFDDMVLKSENGYSGRMGKPVGEYKGFKIYLPDGGKYMEMPDGNQEKVSVVLEGPSGMLYPARRSLRSVDSVIRGIPKHSETKTAIAQQAQRDLETMRGRIGKEYHRMAEMTAKQAELKALDENLKGTGETFGTSAPVVEIPNGPRHTKFRPVNTKWLTDNANAQELAETLHHAGLYRNSGLAVKLPEALKTTMLEKQPYYAKLAREQTEPTEHVLATQKLLATPHQEQPMTFMADRTTRKRVGWGRKEEYQENNHAIYQRPDGKYTALDGEYVSTLQHMYPNATFHYPNDERHPVVVKNGAEPVGVLQPLDFSQVELENHVNEQKPEPAVEQYSRQHATSMRGGQGSMAAVAAAITRALQQVGK